MANLLNTRVELLCQNTGKTFFIDTRKPHVKKTCWWCNRETFEVVLGEGRGNVVVNYTDAFGCVRVLDKIDVDTHTGLAQYNATTGTFLLVEQTKP